MNPLSKPFLLITTPLLLISTLFCGEVPQHSFNIFGSQSVSAQSLEKLNVSQLYKNANPAVVTIKTEAGLSSGFLVYSKGLVITNAHVIPKGRRTISVHLQDGRQFLADVVGYAHQGVDLAALRISGQAPLPTLPIAKHGATQAGQSIFVIGTPDGEDYQNTLSEGTINQVDPKTGILQHQANTPTGYSGAPLLNRAGQVVGVHSANNVKFAVVGTSDPVISETHNEQKSAVSLPQLKGFLQDIEDGKSSTASTLPSSDDSLSIPTIPFNGASILGALTPEDTSMKGTNNMDLFMFKGKKNQSIRMTLKSNEFDPKLVLMKMTESQGQKRLKVIAQNSDSSKDNPYSQLKITLSKDATYFIGIANSEADQYGYYTLKAVRA